MKKIVFLSLILVLLCVGQVAAKSRTYGKGIQLTEVTKISTILDNPESYEGKRVKVAGMVVGVCASRGCWIYLTSDRPYEKIQVKVTDGEIVFPMSASGHQAQVEGVVDVMNLTLEQMTNYERHLAEERGEAFDPATVKGPGKLVRIIGLGAEIEE